MADDLVPVRSRVPPYVLVSGPEALLAERAVAHTVEEVRVRHPDLQVSRLHPAGYESGEIARRISPSLFGGATCLVIHDADEAGDELQRDMLAVLARPAEDDVTVIVVHRGGNRGKKVLDALREAGARVLQAPALKSDRDRTDFAINEFRRARRRATGEAVHAVVNAVGRDLRELAAACQQLVEDTTGVIDEAAVLTYYGGKVEATGFKVADAALSGDAGEALRLLRHAVAVGVDPVPIVAVLAQQVRQVVRVGHAGRGRAADVARGVGLAPWQVERARKTLSGWTPDALAACVRALAAADAEVKGGGRDPVFAVERAVLTMAAERAGAR
jgi:DNA polymerase III subunit delta